MHPRLAVLPQYLLPKQALTVLAGKFASRRLGWLTQIAIRRFVAHYGVDMAEAAEPDVRQYATFNDFFTRALATDARPAAQADFICPVDGFISQFGPIASDRIFQAKGHDYTITALLGGDETAARRYENGAFATLYLSPRDYHRIHMPCDGTLQRMTYVPGSLFSVNPQTARGIPGLFARNERLVCEFVSETHGHFVMVLVGATIVGSMATVWHGMVNPPRSRDIRRWDYPDKQVTLKQDEEMGRFLLGSTVVMLFEEKRVSFTSSWFPAHAIRKGELMAHATSA